MPHHQLFYKFAAITALTFAVLGFVSQAVFKVPVFWEKRSVQSHTKLTQKKAINVAQRRPAGAPTARVNVIPAQPKEDPKKNTAEELLSRQDRQKFEIFFEIWDSRSDNDPRLDRELAHLSRELKSALADFYTQLPREDRSGRGLVSMLIAREAKTLDDLQFIKDVLFEAPCVSLQNCEKLDGIEDAHHRDTNNTTLFYPQLAALYQLQKALQGNPELFKDAQFQNALKSIVSLAQGSPSAQVRRLAAAISGIAN